jgi:ADP-ribose pyrophosphatase
VTDNDEVLGAGRFLRLRRRNGWELVERPGIDDVAVLIAVTPSDELVLVEQYREPVEARMIELPAGLVGDDAAFDSESLLQAANRELQEETGFSAHELSVVVRAPSSGGMTSEIVTFIYASGLTKVGDGGVEGEDIRVHVVPITGIDGWLADRNSEGYLIDPKIYAGLRLLTHTVNYSVSTTAPVP